ncbi:MAG TPA: hypothetical protein VE219_01070, partial [Candidatus Sulfotelmatobacter sp.]|nr:hypothetical protein [Candidatus Sulfotelmatobacter sp.]
EEARAAEARCQSLRQEIAATGLATLDANDLETTANLLDDALDSGAGSRGLTWAAVGIGLLSLITTVVSLVAGIDRVALGILIGGGVTAMVMALGASISGRHSRLALRELEVRCPALDLSPTALRGAVARLPALRRLQTELRSQEVIAEAHRNEIELSRQRAADLAGQCDELLTELGLQLPALHLRPIEEPNSIEALVTRGRAAVSAVIDAVDAARWRDTLHKEDATLEERETDLLRLGEEAQDRADEHAQLEARLRRGLAECGVASDSDLQQALGFFRHACAARRRHDECSEALFAVRRRKSALGVNRGQLGRLAAHLSAELRARGGDPEAPLRANQENGTVPAPFDPNHLQALEREVEFARRRSTSARASAGELRARLSGTLEGLPNLADLEDERAVCAAARERALRQLEALKLAATVIGASTEGVHRALAPRLAESVGRRLALLSEGRYREVSVAMEDFRVSMLGIERPDFIPLELLSQGTRDQVSLLLRLALCEALGERRESIPLLLDEPLLTADRSRREAALDFLVALSESNQVVLAASDPDVAERVERRVGSECAVVAMRRPQGALSLRD